MTERQFLQLQVIELSRLRQSAGNDAILGPQLDERLKDASEALAAAEHVDGSLLPARDVEMPRAAIFMRGGGVEGSAGIRPGLAGNALIQYEKMFTAQALHDERAAAVSAGRQRRPRGSATPELLFTGTPRGSFGLEFAPKATGDAGLAKVHEQSLQNLADSISQIAASDAAQAEEKLRELPPSVLQPLKQFVKVLAEYGAELRLAFPQKGSRTVTRDQLKQASDRLEREVLQVDLEVEGTFRGVTRESGHFDLKLENEVITGFVSDKFSEDDLDRLHNLTNHKCRATIQKTVVSTVAGASPPEYILIDAQLLDDSPR